MPPAEHARGAHDAEADDRRDVEPERVRVVVDERRVDHVRGR